MFLLSTAIWNALAEQKSFFSNATVLLLLLLSSSLSLPIRSFSDSSFGSTYSSTSSSSSTTISSSSTTCLFIESIVLFTSFNVHCPNLFPLGLPNNFLVNLFFFALSYPLLLVKSVSFNVNLGIFFLIVLFTIQ